MSVVSVCFLSPVHFCLGLVTLQMLHMIDSVTYYARLQNH